MQSSSNYPVFTEEMKKDYTILVPNMLPIQFGLILVYNLCIGNITPPVGNTLFVSIKIGNTTLARVMPYMLMYYVAILIGLLLVTYVPAVSLALPAAAGLV